jgi:hypothetical protein
MNRLANLVEAGCDPNSGDLFGSRMNRCHLMTGVMQQLDRLIRVTVGFGARTEHDDMPGVSGREGTDHCPLR